MHEKRAQPRLLCAVLAHLLTGLNGLPHLQADDATASKHQGLFYTAEVTPISNTNRSGIEFRFANLEHRTPWCMFMLELNQSVDLSNGETLWLQFATVSDDLTVKVELRDENSKDLTTRSALRYENLAAGSNQQLAIAGKSPLDGLHPHGWQRKVLWPDWQRIRYVGVIIESRVNLISSGTLHLNAIYQITASGQRTALEFHEDNIRFFEYKPAQIFRPKPSSDPTQPNQSRTYLLTKPEATVTLKRDDPSSALFLSGAGFKLDLDPRSVVGISGQTELKEERHRIDALLINDVRKRPLAKDAGIPFDPRSMLSEPVDVQRTAGSLILDDPDRPDLPRFTYTFEDAAVDSDSSIKLDFDLEIHETALLWTTPYLDTGRRYRLTFEPIYQHIRSTGISEFHVVTGAPVVPRRQLREVHRGLINAVLRDEWKQREFLFQVLHGRADNIVDKVDETQWQFRAQWRQWHGVHKTAFSEVGVVYRDTDFDSATAGLDGRSRDFEIFANLITELDQHGQWRWFNQVTYNHHDVDIVVFDPVPVKLVSTNRVYDFVRIESRFTFEVIKDLDISMGLEHEAADFHRFDNLGFVAKASLFNYGPFRAEIAARRTWYYNLDEELNTVMLKIDFAQ